MCCKAKRRRGSPIVLESIDNIRTQTKKQKTTNDEAGKDSTGGKEGGLTFLPCFPPTGPAETHVYGFAFSN